MHTFYKFTYRILVQLQLEKKRMGLTISIYFNSEFYNVIISPGNDVMTICLLNVIIIGKIKLFAQAIYTRTCTLRPINEK